MQKFSFNQDINTIAIVCNQWGDTGKGKFVDYFTPWADIVARGTGGANAGHTIQKDGKDIVVHLLPSSILYDREGKISIIGNGVAFDPMQCLEEAHMVRGLGYPVEHLLISHRAKLVLPQHILLDRAREMASGKNRLGTTGRGIGPVYADFYARVGLFVNDLLNKDIFARRLQQNLSEKLKILNTFDRELLKKILEQPLLGAGIFYDEQNILNIEAIVETYCEKYASELKEYIADTDTFLRNHVGKKRILLEGAQGLLLSVDYGSYPYVTSSDCSIEGLVKGVGLKEKNVDLTLGIVKAFYMTRVGSGPFPTEFGGVASENYCEGKDRAHEEQNFSNASVNDNDELTQGIAIRLAGHEYGATTGRPRRTGWLDLPLLRRSIMINGGEIILTKLDVLDGCQQIKICSEYEYIGSTFQRGKELFLHGQRIRVAPVEAELLRYCRPIYEVFPGWVQPIRNFRVYEDLPMNLQNIIEYVERESGSQVRFISVGPDALETIEKTPGKLLQPASPVETHALQY